MHEMSAELLMTQTIFGPHGLGSQGSTPPPPSSFCFFWGGDIIYINDPDLPKKIYTWEATSEEKRTRNGIVAEKKKTDLILEEGQEKNKQYFCGGDERPSKKVLFLLLFLGATAELRLRQRKEDDGCMAVSGRRGNQPRKERERGGRFLWNNRTCFFGLRSLCQGSSGLANSVRRRRRPCRAWRRKVLFLQKSMFSSISS